ncbi:hypothetical protein L7F22_032498 [Adiantum nelumboides]|nr:hypothetical protein [Adiantum nelumboides]
MPRDVGFACKKRHHPDGLHVSNYSPKRLLSISEAELGSSIDTATLDSAHGSLWNSASAAITSDCSNSMCAGSSTMSMNVVTSKPPSSAYTLSHASSRSASHSTEASGSSRGSPFEARCKDVWMYGSAASKRERTTFDSLKCERTVSDSQCSEVTHPRTSSISSREFEGVTHIISRREKSSLNPKWCINEARGKDAFGSDSMLQGKRFDISSSLHSTSGRGGFTFSSMASESGSTCATRDSFMEEARPALGSSHIYGSVCKDPFVTSPNVHNEGAVGMRAQERIGGLEYINTRGHSSPEVEFNSPFLHKGKSEELGPSYVLSSGRLSLEEEARLGRRAPTIDHDFEEYFSALMLE